MNTTIRFGTATATATVTQWEYETPFNYTNMMVIINHLPEGMEVVVVHATVEYYNAGVTPVTTVAALAEAIGLPVGDLGSELAEANL